MTPRRPRAPTAKLPAAGDQASARSGSEAGYAAVAAAHPERTFIVSCDLDVSTKLGKAKAQQAADHSGQTSIEEQAAGLIADGLALSARPPQRNAVSAVAPSLEPIGRE